MNQSKMKKNNRKLYSSEQYWSNKNRRSIIEIKKKDLIEEYGRKSIYLTSKQFVK